MQLSQSLIIVWIDEWELSGFTSLHAKVDILHCKLPLCIFIHAKIGEIADFSPLYFVKKLRLISSDAYVHHNQTLMLIRIAITRDYLFSLKHVWTLIQVSPWSYCSQVKAVEKWPIKGQNSGLPSSLLESSPDMLPNSFVPVEFRVGQEVFRNPLPVTQFMTLMSQSREMLIYWQHEREHPVHVFFYGQPAWPGFSHRA